MDPTHPRLHTFLPPKQKRDTPRNFEMKRLFRNAFSERSKRSEKERDERSLHRVSGPCFQVRPFLLAELKKDTPRNFDMKRLIRNAFSELRMKGQACLRSPGPCPILIRATASLKKMLTSQNPRNPEKFKVTRK